MLIALRYQDSFYVHMNQTKLAPQPPRDLRWSEETRLRAIDAAAFWEGRVNRADLIRRFGISVPQATNDLREYQARAPGNLRYDGRAKTYVSEPGFRPLFGAPSAEAWLSAGESGAAASVPVEVTPLPARRIDPWLLRRLLEVRRAGATGMFGEDVSERQADLGWLGVALRQGRRDGSVDRGGEVRPGGKGHVEQRRPDVVFGVRLASGADLMQLVHENSYYAHCIAISR